MLKKLTWSLSGHKTWSTDNAAPASPVRRGSQGKIVTTTQPGNGVPASPVRRGSQGKIVTTNQPAPSSALSQQGRQASSGAEQTATGSSRKQIEAHRTLSLRTLPKTTAADADSDQSSGRSSVQHKTSVQEERQNVHSNGVAAKSISVFPYTYDPTTSWEILKDRHPVKTVKPLKLDTPMKQDFVRFVCISDIHGKKLSANRIPDGDVLIVAGDFTTCGHPDEIRDFNKFLGTLPHPYKLLVAGNHELTLDPLLKKANYMGFEKIFKNFDARGYHADDGSNEFAHVRAAIQEALEDQEITDVRSLLTNCTYLEDCEVVIMGLRIYGTPWYWQPSFDNWAFNLPRGNACLEKWNCIPADIDVLITHTPPLGYGDLTRTGVRCGCVELLNSVRQRIKPKVHVYGHIHEGYGCTSDGYTKFINCCVCDAFNKPINAPILFDLPLPAEYQKRQDKAILRAHGTG